MISVSNLTIRFNGVDLFKGVSFLVNPKDRIGLTGKNGAGKSTLLKVFTRNLPPDEGSIVVPQDVRLGYLPQEMMLNDGKTVMEETLSAFSHIHAMSAEIDAINVQLAERTDYESEEYDKLIHRVADLAEQLHMQGSDNMAGDAEITLMGLGFRRSDFNRQTSEFSGGWRMRIELAKILLQRPHVFLLDEPTNHLDIESIQWLEDFLKDYNGAVILISHDRAFLDAVTNRTIEITLGRIEDYKASYSKYVELRRERREQQLAAYQNQQKMIEDTETFINRFRYQASKSVQVQSRIKMLEKVERLEVEEEDKAAIHFSFPPAPRSGKVVVHAKEVTKCYGEKTVFQSVSLEIERGEKVAFIGRNGEGKTTMSRCIVSETDYTGEITLGHNVNIGYFAQNQDEIMQGDKTVFETLDDIAVGEIRKKVRDILGAFLFSGEDVDKKVKVLSGGERNRLAMAKLLLVPYNVLVLDEPTNHLDIRSKDILKQALKRYDGTLILVSHDRDFLDGLVNKVFEFRDGGVKEHLGGVKEFLEKRNIESFKEIEQKLPEVKVQSEIKVDQASAVTLSYEEKKQREREQRKIQTAIKQSEVEIAQLEQEIASLNVILSEGASDQSLFLKHGQLEKQLEAAMERWTALNEELEL